MKSSAKSLTLSVGTLVEFSARSGDLFAEAPSGPSSLEGIAGHQKIQKSRGDDWQCEVRLKATLLLDEYQLTLQGRLDLLNEVELPPIIEEIKTSYTAPVNIPEEKKNLHWAQAKVYAYLFALEKQQSDASWDSHTPLNVCVSWFDLTTGQLHQQQQIFTLGQLAEYTLMLAKIYLVWHKEIVALHQTVHQSAKAIEFPFNQYRPGQYDFARQVYRAAREKQQLLVEAPTGTGKTMSTLFPMVKAIGESLVKQIIYLTAKGSAQTTAQNTLAILQQNMTLDTLTIQAKDKACPCRSANPEQSGVCNNGDGRCNRTVGFFDRLPAARLACLKENNLDPATLQKIADTYQLCPFELSLQMIRWRSIVICDFNYVFDPLVHLAVFDEDKNSRVLLIDEIHNLPDRGNAMYSASLSANDCKIIARQLKSSPILKKSVQKLANQLNRLTDSEAHWQETPKGVNNAIYELLETLGSSDISSGFGGDLFTHQPEGFTEWLKLVIRFRVISELFGESHIALAKNLASAKSQKKTAKNILLQLICLDASKFLARHYQAARAVIGFSATLSPTTYYLTTLGFDDAAATLTIPAIFPKENQLTLRCDYIDTRWQQRSDSLPELCQLINNVATRKTGKYLVFFPSYEYLNNCFELYSKQNSHPILIKQDRGSSDRDRIEFLNHFFSDDLNSDDSTTGNPSTVGFAILGGIFGEGVDFVGDALTGAIIIGTGMPQPTTDQKLLEAHFVANGLNGFQFAYQFPGFTRVKQTAGRVIRSETDRGVVVLVDPRFKRPDYLQLMPAHWIVVPVKSSEEMRNSIDTFWQAE